MRCRPFFVALNKFKDAAIRACAKARQAILTNTPTTLGAKLLVACTCPARIQKWLDCHRQAVLRVLGTSCQMLRPRILWSVSFSVRSVTLLKASRGKTSVTTRKNSLVLTLTKLGKTDFRKMRCKPTTGCKKNEAHHPCHLGCRWCASS